MNDYVSQISEPKTKIKFRFPTVILYSYRLSVGIHRIKLKIKYVSDIVNPEGRVR